MPNGDAPHPVYITTTLAGFKIPIDKTYVVDHAMQKECPSCSKVVDQENRDLKFCGYCGTSVRRYQPQCTLLDKEGNDRAYEIAFHTKHPHPHFSTSDHGYTMEDDYEKGLSSFMCQALQLAKKRLGAAKVRLVDEYWYDCGHNPKFWFIGYSGIDLEFASAEKVINSIIYEARDILGASEVIEELPLTTYTWSERH